MGFNLVAVKKTFFDKAAVLSKVDPAKARALSRFGAFVRQRARSSIRTRKGISPPGSPPYSHVGTLKKSILFGYDQKADTVVIGPLPAGRGGIGALALERGGRVSRPGLRGGRALNYRARPFMRPAFEAELPKAAALLKGMVR